MNMTIEQKAKAFDEAIDRAEKVNDTWESTPSSVAEYIFPQLRESYDDKIRKALISILKSDFEKETLIYDISVGDIITWLENQVQKSLPNVSKEITKDKKSATSFLKSAGIMNEKGELAKEYRNDTEDEQTLKFFQEGDWIVYKNEVCQITHRENGFNLLTNIYGVQKEPVNEGNLSTARHWTIQDAKPGDILSWDHERYTIIFMRIQNSKIIAYCSYNIHDDHFGAITLYDTQFDLDLKFQPASKIAKDVLLLKIKENNYEWDPYKLTLSKTEAITCTESCVAGDIKPGKLSMSLKSFIENFSHNNEIWIENKDNFCMYHKYYPEDDKHDCTVMDWMMQYSDIYGCNVIRISNVIHSNHTNVITIVVNTDKTEFTFLPELVTLDNSPVWFYDKVHQTKTKVHCDA